MNEHKSIQFKFFPGDRVRILAIDEVGYVTGLYVCSGGTTYQIAYWSNGSRNEIYVRVEELDSGTYPPLE